eukprot:CAMPEP_0168718230 /NCGR_PEP_ID=MMETSP0724-20121128/408_1 /TAXON_ID=265536 /ORGANISM="Amphiprora sp., Strain CCMP467" /LENGTH=524 /DNA_ID=CAMNT_0008764731 /DNA_START=21 /DNA_END=1592 /DNA_ORIENTATION=+
MAFSTPSTAESSSSSTPDRILFGSCNSQFQPQPLWPTIISRNASAFVWAGDAYYSDSKKHGVESAATPELLAQSSQAQLDQLGYQELMKQERTAIIGTWDDHDFGINNGDAQYPWKQKAAEEYLTFLRDSNRNKKNDEKLQWPILESRVNNRKGVYSMVVFDFEREGDPLVVDESFSTPLSNRSVAIFLLDVRYNKTPWKAPWNGVFQDLYGDYEGDFLGKDQWEWFEASISKSTARVNIVVTGLQVHTDRFFEGKIVEEWSRFPLSQHRLYQNLLRPNVRSPLIVSGDVHMAELLRRDCQRPHDWKQQTVNAGVMRSLVEVTTSGMTHSWGSSVCIGETFTCIPTYAQWFTSFAMHVAHINHGWRNLIDNNGPPQEGAKRRVQYTLDLNFAEFEFDWENEQVKARLWGIDSSDNEEASTAKRPLLSNAWKFDQLSVSFQPTGKLKSKDFQRQLEQLQVGALEANQGSLVTENDWICLPHRGTMPPYVKLIGPLSALGLSFTIFYLGPIILPLLLLFVLVRKFY